MRAGTTSVALAIGVAVLAPVGQAGAATSRAEAAGRVASAPSAFDPTGSEWSVNNHAIHWLFREGGLVEAPGAWRGHWTMSGGEASVEIGEDRFTVRFDPDGQSFTAYKAGQVYRNGVRVRATASAGARAGDPSERPGGGYWRLERVDFSNQAGADTWTGQSEMRIALTSHDNSHMSFREVWRATTSEAYQVDWSIPDILRPGETAPFALSETCLQSTLGQGWPFPTIPMAPVSLVSDFNRDAYLQLGDPPCTPGATAKAGPSLTWTIPAGKPGDTTKVRVSAGPTYWSSVEVTWLFRWSEGTAPPASAGRTPATAHGPSADLGPPAGDGTLPLGAPPEPVIWRNGADGAVRPSPYSPTTFQVTSPTLVTQIMTYHYGAHGRPGTIAIRAADGAMFGPWPAAGAGSPSQPNVYWWVRPDITLAPGLYTIIDSDPATWSVEDATRGAGIAQLWGRAP